MSRANIIAALMVAAVAAIAIYALHDLTERCDARHGTLVRGIFGYECIKAVPA